LAKLCRPVQNLFTGIEHRPREEIDEICTECKAEARSGTAADRTAARAAERGASQFGMVLFAAVQTLVREGELG